MKKLLEIAEKASFKWVLCGEAALLLLIVGLVSYQVRVVKQKIGEMADLKDPSPFTAVLAGDMGQINLALATYLQNRDPHALEQIPVAQKHFEDSLAVFQAENSRILTKDKQAKILDAFEPFKETPSRLVELIDGQSQKSNRLLNDQDEIMNTFEYRLRPLVHPNQPWSRVRLDLISNLENESRLVPEAMTRALIGKNSPDNESHMYERRFEKFFSLYEPMAQTGAERRDLRHVRQLWNDLTGLVVDIAGLEQAKSEAFTHFMDAHRELQSVILTTLPPVRPEVIQQKKDAILRAIRWMIACAVLLVLAGGGSSIFAALWMYRRFRFALQEIQAVTDAAVTGDLSRKASVRLSTPQVGEMASSVNRLIGVLRRSEQLILQLGSIVESSGDGSIGLTTEGTILSWNNGAARMYGYPISEVKDQSIDVLFPATQTSAFATLVEKLGRRRMTSIETVHLRKSGVPINVRLTISRILDTTGRTIGLSLLSRELSVAVEGPTPTERSTRSAGIEAA